MGFDNLSLYFDYDYAASIPLTIITSFFLGCFIGVVEIFYFHNRFRKYSFGKAILYKFGIYILFIVTFGTLLLTASFAYFSQTHIFSDKVMQAVKWYFTSPMVYIGDLSFMFIMIAVTSIMLQINDKFGPGVMWQMIRGKYHQPKVESRIFMFLDIKSSTTIAERLGHKSYFNLLNDFFHDLTNPILLNRGEVYQYVGDELTISWPLKKGLHKANCIHVFFECQKAIADNRDSYIKKYGLFPVFKAGLHFGEVTTGEIGVIKKDIVFSGDVLNTASRIEGMCNVFGCSLLVSKPLLDMMELDSQYECKELGKVELRGKSEKIAVCSVEEKDSEKIKVA